MAKITKKKKTRKTYPERAKDVQVTQGMLFEFREEFSAHARETSPRFENLDAKIDKRFHEIKLLVEEQNARNRIVLDGLTNLFARQERVETKLDRLSNGD